MRRPSVLLAMGVMAGASVVSPVSANEPVQVTQPLNSTRFDQDPARTYTSPSMAVDPENSRNVVMGYVEARTRRCGLMRSTDSGQTWTRLDSTPSLPSYPSCFAISATVNMIPVAFGRNSTLYYALNGYGEEDGGISRGNMSVLLARSHDLGDTWETVVARDTRGKTGEATETIRPVSDMAVDTWSGPNDIIHIAYRVQYPLTSAPNAQPRLPAVITSTDGGRTFADPVNAAAAAWERADLRTAALGSATTLPGATTTTAVPGSRASVPDQAANFGGSNPSLTVDRRGHVYVAWNTHSSNITPAPANALFLSKSTDRGKTFTASPITPFREVLQSCCSARIRWSPEGGSQGSLHVVYEGMRRPEIATEADTFYRRSVDGGATWTAPKSLNDDDPAQLFGQYSPNLAIAPNGRIDVAWFDSRTDPGIRAHDVYLSSSSDNGGTWTPNTRISDVPIDRRMGIWGNGFDVSSPPGLASTDSLAIVSWDDTRNGSPANPVQDLYTSIVQHEPVSAGGAPVAVKVIIAAVLGLAALGLVLALVGRAARPPEGPPAPSRPLVSHGAGQGGT